MEFFPLCPREQKDQHQAGDHYAFFDVSGELMQLIERYTIGIGWWCCVDRSAGGDAIRFHARDDRELRERGQQ